MSESNTRTQAYFCTRWLFLRALALVYFLAFLSLAVQINGLIGEQGILPAANFLNMIAGHMQAQPFWLLPTVFWMNASDFALHAVCVLGILFSLLAFSGIATVFSFTVLWFFYLSLVNVGQDFLSFQWDILLLETGFLAIFLAPWQWLEAPHRIKLGNFQWIASRIKPPIIIIWLLRWLLFRLMFESGLVKLASGDPAWRNLTALNYHYFSQPLPTPLAWYAAKLPAWFNEFSVVMVFVIELIVPFLIFAGRKARLIVAVTFLLFQILIAITGNYAFFNLLAVVLCISLLDDQVLDDLRIKFALYLSRIPLLNKLLILLNKLLVCRIEGLGQHDSESRQSQIQSELLPLSKTQKIVSLVAAILIAFLSIGSMRGISGLLSLPAFLENVLDISGRYFICNSYGLFAVMTTQRLEIQIEGSNDGIFWDEYGFKYKPGDLAKAPPIVAPHQPRLDWQMWFAALSDFRNNPWFLNLAFRLLRGEPSVLKLLANNPFPNSPPKYIRARLYDYHFTNESEHQKTGNWWKRELVGEYLPALAIDGQK